MIMDNSVLGKSKIDFQPIMVWNLSSVIGVYLYLAMYLNYSSLCLKNVVVVLYLIYYSIL